MRTFPSVLAAFGLLVSARSALAADLGYEAPPECPSREAAVARLGRDSNARAAVITIRRRAGGGFAADAHLGEGEESMTRHLEGETCEGILDAFRVVLALDKGSPASEVKVEREAAPPAAVPAPPLAEPKEPKETKEQPETPDVRSSVEIGIGYDGSLRSLAGKAMIGAAGFVEISAPELGARWYRPSARLGVGWWGTMMAFEDTTTLLGSLFDVCPLGGAIVSSRYVDLTLSACGVVHLGSGKHRQPALWADAGTLARVLIQIGRKGHVRGFITVDGGPLWRIGNRMDMRQDASKVDPGFVIITNRDTTQTSAMWTFSQGAGLLFP